MITIATNCRPTRHLMSFWLRFGLVPRDMAHRPAQHEKNREHCDGREVE